MSKTISFITIKALPFWNSLLEENLNFLELGFDYPVFGVHTVKELLNKIDKFYSQKTVWLIQYKEKIVGIFAVGNFPEPIDGKNDWYETVIYVHPEYRKLGIAKMLTLSTAKSFEKKPWLSLLVEVRTDNEISIKSHNKIFPEVTPVHVKHENFEAYQWRLQEQHKISEYNPWLAEEIGLGMLRATKNSD